MCSLNLSDSEISPKERQADWWNLFQNSEFLAKSERPSQPFVNCGSSESQAWQDDDLSWGGCFYSPRSKSSDGKERTMVYSPRYVQSVAIDETSAIANSWAVNCFDEKDIHSIQAAKNKMQVQEQGQGQPLPKGRMRETKVRLARDAPMNSFIHKRNERERERVRCVNEGYAELRRKLPFEFKHEKKISKVETLRYAIMYIKHLQALINEPAPTAGSYGGPKL